MDQPYNKSVDITKSDTVDIYPFLASGRLTDAVYVGGAGIVVGIDQSGNANNYTAVAGEILPIAVRRVNSGTTTATLMVALYQV